jgi:hypothetical protein
MNVYNIVLSARNRSRQGLIDRLFILVQLILTTTQEEKTKERREKESKTQYENA